jgi:small conductance mechanosensitive channel
VARTVAVGTIGGGGAAMDLLPLAKLLAAAGDDPPGASAAQLVPGGLLPFLAVAGIELAVVVAVAVAGYAIAAMTLRRLAAFGAGMAEMARSLRGSLRVVASLVVAAAALAVLGGNGWLAYGGTDVAQYTRERLAAIPPEAWVALGIAVAKLAAAALGVAVAARVVRTLLGMLERRIGRWDQLKDNDRSLAAFFAGLDHALVNTAWLMLALAGCWLLGLPEAAAAVLAALIRIYLVIAIGVLVIRATAVIVDTLEGLSHRFASRRTWLRYYERLRPLVPLFRRCLEYALWITIATLVSAQIQLSPFARLAAYGPPLVEIIGIFFLGRVAIEIGYLVISGTLLGAAGLDDIERRRRATIVPLLSSIYRYACYFVMFIMSLSALGIDYQPYLLGVGALSVVIGFGAQSLINDVVSGFFILFENTYLVGDVIEGAGASGTVEAIEFRTTRIRDDDGRVHIVRNGDMKQVVNFSKEFAKAVVPVEVGYGSDVRRVFAILAETGQRLKELDPDVVAPTEIDGITGFGGAALTVRTSTRVKPGRHEAVAAHFRLLIKDAMDHEAAALPGPRGALVPPIPAPAGPPAAG